MDSGVIHYAAAAASDRGRKRSSNEDAYGFSVECGVYIVCDGMGGAAAGEIASSLAVDEALRVLTSRDVALPLENAVDQAIHAANEAIYSRARRNPRLSGMGTTLVGLVAEERRVLVFNVGDSRCYRVRKIRPSQNGPEQSGPEQDNPEKGILRSKSILEQISQDHSLVEEQVRTGRITRAAAQRSPIRNVITRALGTQSVVTPDLFELEAEPGDLFLLCTDGLTGEIDDPLIQSILEADLPLDDLCVRLVSAANKSGGHDNITCLLLRVE